MINLFIYVLVSISSIFAAVNLSLADVDLDSGTLSVNIDSDEIVGGFQFDLTGVEVTGASGGLAGSSGFTFSNSSSTVLAFSLTGGTIQPGEGVLVNVSFTGFVSEICLASVVMSSGAGTALDVNIGDCFTQTGGCTDVSACNFDSSASFDDGSCAYVEDCAGECGGTAELDCAGECGGTAELDCAGECGGTAELDCAGECGGTAELDCAGECGGTAELDACGVCDGTETDPNNCFDQNTLYLQMNANGNLDVYMYNEDPVAGFSLT